MQKKLLIILFSLLAFIFLSAQTCSLAWTEKSCYENEDCAEEYICSNGICSSEEGVEEEVEVEEGLVGEYFSDTDLRRWGFGRVDSEINFDWGEDPLYYDGFSARWTGQVYADSDEQYTFYTQSDDGTKLWVDGNLIIDDWQPHAEEERQEIIQLSEGWHDIELEYFDSGGYAVVKLLYESNSVPKQIIPSNKLKHDIVCGDTACEAGEEGACPIDCEEVSFMLLAATKDYVWPYWIRKQFDQNSQGYFPSNTNRYYMNWNIIGLPNEDQESIVGPDASLTPNTESFTVSFWFYDHDNDIFYPLKKENVEKKLYNSLPISISSSDFNDVEISVEAFSDAVSSRGVNFVEVTARNVASNAKHLSLFVVVRPYGPYGYYPIYDLKYDDTNKVVYVDNLVGVILEETPDDFALFDSTSEVSVDIMDGGISATPTAIYDINGLATGAVEYDFIVSGNSERSFVLKIPANPFDSSESIAIASIRNAQLSSHRNNVESVWSNILSDGMQISIPNKEMERAYYSSLSYLHLLKDIDEIHPGGAGYDSFWMRDTAFMAYALDMTSYTDYTLAILSKLISYKQQNGWFASENEVEYEEWDAAGQALFVLVEHYRLSRDANWLSSIYPHLEDQVIWINNKRLQQNNKLLPSGWSAEHLGQSECQHYWDNFWALRGIKEVIFAAEELGYNDDVSLFTQYYNDYMSDLELSFSTVMAHRDIDYIPESPMYDNPVCDDGWLVGTMAAFWPTQALDLDDSHVINAIDILYQDITQQDSGFFSYLAMQMAHNYIYLSELDRAWDAIDWFMSRQMAPDAWTENTDLMGPETGDGDIPHGWAAAEYVLLMKEMLLYPEGSDLHLFKGVPVDWFIEGDEISVTNALTPFGKFNIELTTGTGSITINLDQTVTFTPFDNYVVHLPEEFAIERVLVDGSELPSISEDGIEVSSSAIQIFIEFSRNS